MAEVASLFVRLGANISGFSNGFKKAEKDLKKFERSSRRTAENFKSVGKAGMVAGGAIVTGLGLAAKQAIDFESSFAGVRKTVDATEAEYAELAGAFRKMAKEIPTNVNELNKIGEAAGQLGIEKENIVGFTRVMADLGVATNMSSDEAATSLARLANITQMPQSEFDKLGSTIVELGNNLATTESEITEMSLRIAGAGHQVGMTEAEILGFSGALSSVGIKAEAGGSAISKVMINMASAVQSGGKELEGFANVAGQSTSDFQKSFEEDASGAMLSFIEGLGEMKDSGENVFGVLDELGMSEVRMRDALLRASGAGDLFRESLDLGSKAWGENNALTKEAETRYKTTASRLKILWNQIKDVVLTIGGAMLPVVDSLIESLQPLISTIEKAATWFSNLSPTLQKTIAMAAALTGVFFIVGGALLFVIGFIPAIVAGLGMVAGVFATLLSPVALIVAAIIGLGAAFVLAYNKVEWFRDAVNGAWEHIKQAFSVALEFVKGIVKTVMTEVSALIGQQLTKIQSFWDQNGAQIMQAAKNVFGFIRTAITSVMNVIWAIMKFVWPAIKMLLISTWNAIKNVIQGAVNIVLGIIKTFAALFTGDWKGVWEGVKQILGGAVQAVWGLINLWLIGKVLKIATFFGKQALNIFRLAWNGVKNVTMSVLKGIVNFVKGRINFVLNFIKSLQLRFRAAGQGLMDMLRQGIVNSAKKVIDSVKGIAKKVRDFLPFSPAKEGPLSDLDKLDFAGPISKSISKGLPKVQTSMRHLVNMPKMPTQAGAMAPATAQSVGQGSRGTTVIVELDGRTLMKAISRQQGETLRVRGAVR